MWSTSAKAQGWGENIKVSGARVGEPSGKLAGDEVQAVTSTLPPEPSQRWTVCRTATGYPTTHSTNVRRQQMLGNRALVSLSLSISVCLDHAVRVLCLARREFGHWPFPWEDLTAPVHLGLRRGHIVFYTRYSLPAQNPPGLAAGQDQQLVPSCSRHLTRECALLLFMLGMSCTRTTIWWHKKLGGKFS